MSFNKQCSPYVHTAVPICLTDYSLLGFTTWLSDTRSSTVLVHGSGTNNSADGIVVTYCINQKLQDDNPKAFTTGVAIGTIIKAVPFDFG